MTPPNVRDVIFRKKQNKIVFYWFY